MAGRLPIKWTREIDAIIRDGAAQGMTKAYVAKVLGISSTVHPRVCGEQRSLTNPSTLSYGSSPRVRGTGFPWRCQVC